MEILPVAYVFQIQLDQSESEVFKRGLPGSRDIEGFIENVREEGSMITVNTEGETVFLEVEVDADYHPLYGEAKREAARIQRAIEKFVRGE